MTKYKWDIPTNKDKIIGWQGKRIIALEDELDALREAVAWERECLDTWEYGTALKMQALDEQVASMNASRAEVDRLLKEQP